MAIKRMLENKVHSLLDVSWSEKMAPLSYTRERSVRYTLQNIGDSTNKGIKT